MIMHSLGDTVEERIGVPLREKDNRGTADEVKETRHVEAKSMVNWDHNEGYLKPLRSVPHRWLANGSGKRRMKRQDRHTAWILPTSMAYTIIPSRA
jgi:hypothetical protein